MSPPTCFPCSAFLCDVLQIAVLDEQNEEHALECLDEEMFEIKLAVTEALCEEEITHMATLIVHIQAGIAARGQE